MEKVVIPIKTTKEKFASDLLTILHPILKLKKREKEILSTLMLLHNTNKNIEGGRLNKLLFSTQIRKRIRKFLDPPMSEASYNNHLCQLKDKKIIVNNTISPSLVNLYKNKVSITYELSNLSE